MHRIVSSLLLLLIRDTALACCVRLAVACGAGTKDLQTVDLTLRVLYKPVESALPRIFSELGRDYDERVLPSIGR